MKNYEKKSHYRQQKLPNAVLASSTPITNTNNRKNSDTQNSAIGTATASSSSITLVDTSTPYKTSSVPNYTYNNQ